MQVVISKNLNNRFVVAYDKSNMDEPLNLPQDYVLIRSNYDCDQDLNPDLWKYLPTELVDIILERLIWDSFNVRCYYDTFLLLQSKRRYMIKFMKAFGSTNVHQVIKRTARLINLLSDIDDSLSVHCDNPFHVFGYDISVNLRSGMEPWEYRKGLEVYETEKPWLDGYQTAYHILKTGPTVHDHIYMKGRDLKKYSNIYTTELFQTPVILLGFHYMHGNKMIYPSIDRVRRHFALQAFCSHLKQIYGPHTGVYVKCKDPILESIYYQHNV
jgi:hypothetical protein